MAGTLYVKPTKRKAYSYVRDGKRIRVPATTVKGHKIEDRGKPGRGKKLFDLKAGKLRKYGYSLDKSAAERQKALKRASKADGVGKVEKRVNAIRVLNKSNPEAYRKLNADMEFMKKLYKASKK